MKRDLRHRQGDFRSGRERGADERRADGALATGDAEDAALARLAATRSPRAAALVWDRFAPVVRRVIQRAVGPSGDAGELVHEVFLRFFNRAKTLRDPAAVGDFILTIATSVMISEFRRRRAPGFLGLSTGSGGGMPEQRADDGDDEAREVLRKIYAGLDGVNHFDRMAFVLATLEGAETSVAAAALHTSVPIVKRRVARVHARLHAMVIADASVARHLATSGVAAGAPADHQDDHSSTAGQTAERIAALVRSQLSGVVGPAVEWEGRARMIAVASAHDGSSRRGTIRALAWMGGLALVATAAALVFAPGRALTYRTHDLVRASGGALATQDQVGTIEFSDGSRMTLRPNSQARVDRTSWRGAQVVVGTGRVELEVVHRRLTRWFVAAGPYRIRVTGTSFAVEWSERSRRLEVWMHTGSVRIDGPLVRGDLALHQGERLLVDQARGTTLVGHPPPHSGSAIGH